MPGKRDRLKCVRLGAFRALEHSKTSEDAMSTPVKPKCLAIVVCESVVEDIQTRNKCILNTFNGIFGFRFPCVHPKLVVFATLTNGHGTIPLELKFVQDTTREVLLGLQGAVEFNSPLDIADMVFNLHNLPLPAPGPYSVQIFANGEPIGERRIQVALANIPGQGDQGGPQQAGEQP